MRHLPLTLLLLAALGITSGAAAQSQAHLALTIVDQRPGTPLPAESLVRALRRSLEVLVELAADDADAELGWLVVTVRPKQAVLSWTLPDGRGTAARVALARRLDVTLASIVSTARHMAHRFDAQHGVASGELFDSTFRWAAERREVVSPWPEQEGKRVARRRERMLDVIDPYQPLDRRTRRERETLDPWI